jgi:hypothetical protein
VIVITQARDEARRIAANIAKAAGTRAQPLTIKSRSAYLNILPSCDSTNRVRESLVFAGFVEARNY